MKIVNETNNNGGPQRAGCVCSSGWKNTRGWWQPFRNCNCSCESGNTQNNNANFSKAKNA